jgi:hypothetical protein
LIVGNELLGPQSGYGHDLVEERVYLEDGPVPAMATDYFRGGLQTVNVGLRRFAAASTEVRSAVG